jgi:hypothetical protein
VRRFLVDALHVRAYSNDPKFAKRLVLSRERGEKVVLGIHRSLRYSRLPEKVLEVEIFFRGTPRIEEIKKVVVPPKERAGFGYIYLTPHQALKLAKELVKASIAEYKPRLILSWRAL